MVAIKAIYDFMARPDPALPVVLVYGPDAGLVSERADALIRLAVDDPGDPFALARLNADTLAAQPERLVEEAHTIPLFGGRRAVHVKASERVAPAVARLLKAPPGADCRIIIEAGDLRKTAPLRSQCEASPIAAALPCYADGPRDLARLIDDETRRAGLQITPAARDLLAGLIGGDRRASRSEIEKLVLYVAPQRRIDVPDVVAVVSDATNPALDGLIDAALTGDPARVETLFAKEQAAGTSATTIAGALIRGTAALHGMALAVKSGTPADTVIKRGAHFSREKAVGAALRAWTPAKLEALLARLGEVSLEVRRNSRLAYPMIGRTLLMVAQSVRGRQTR